MIKFDAVDFSERRSEEVMFLLTLSVLLLWNVHQTKLMFETVYWKDHLVEEKKHN